jgi:predicted nucleic acid-binding Zn ribbon protein
VIEELGLAAKLNEYAAVTRWAEIVGDQIARVAVPQRMDKGTLFIHVASAPWRAELATRRLEIQRKLNEAIGSDVVKDIRFR